MFKADLKAGDTIKDRKIEATGSMHALVYFGKERLEVVPDRPIVCTEDDVIARVDMVHRCGTDVKIYSQGRPDQLDESLLEQLQESLGLTGDYDSENLLYYTALLEKGEEGPCDDPFYINLREYIQGLSPEDKANLWPTLKRGWGRILGHEMIVTVDKVGSNVANLKGGIGYRDGDPLELKDLDFKTGDRFIVQTRIADYRPPLAEGDGVRGVQLLGRNITDLAMILNAAYAQYVRLTSEIIRSGSILKVPSGMEDVEAAMVEPAACLLDCFEKSTHELGQDHRGSMLKKGVLPGGITAVIGSGSMAIMAGMMALMEDEIIEVGGAGEVVFFVRSQDKVDLMRKVINDKRISFVIFPKGASDDDVLKCLREQYAPLYRKRYGEDFVGFDDVMVAAGDKNTLAMAHRMITHTGGRVLAFAGTRGSVTLESGVWHYGNAGVVGTSGSNTKMMEIALGLIERRSLSLAKLSGKTYTFSDLKKGIEPFFTDTYLRPKIVPNEGLPSIRWHGED